MRDGLAILLFLALPFAAAAEDAAATVVSEADCRWLVKHVAADDVAYQPGVDVHGRKVASADLSDAGRIEVPREIPINLTIQLRQLPVPVAPELLGRSEIGVGTVTVDRVTGTVMYNGKPVGDSSQAELAAACRERLGAR